MPAQSSSFNEKQSHEESVSLQKRDHLTSHQRSATSCPKNLDWFSSDTVQSYHEMGDPNTTAQVHPYLFTTSMATLAEEKGVKIVLGSVLSINQHGDTIESVTYVEKNDSQPLTITATEVVLCNGPWVRSLYPTAPISALRAHSVVIRPSRPISAYAIFTEIKLPRGFERTKASPRSSRTRGKVVTPEIYSRPNNEAYACGEGDTLMPLPKSTEEVETDMGRCQDIIDHVSSISNELQDGIVTAKQACYLPTVDGGAQGPLIGPTRVHGLLLAVGHSCWGIQNGPATGKLISEFIFDGKALSADIQSLDPRKVL